jgi:hypothetical protein
VVVDPDAHPVAKGNLCGQHAGFNLHAATKVGANDEQGRLALCKYILRPPLANERLTIIDDEHVRLAFKKPWSDGTTSVELSALALIARLAAIVPPPRRHLTGYFGVLSSHSSLRSQCVPVAEPETLVEKEDEPTRAMPLSHYILWSELLRKTFQIDTLCARCKTPLRLIDFGDQDRGDDQEDPGSHGPALPLRGLGTDNPPRPPLALRARPSRRRPSHGRPVLGRPVLHRRKPVRMSGSC